MDAVTPPDAPLLASERALELTTALLTRLFRHFDGNLTLRLWNGNSLRVGKAAGLTPDPAFALLFRHPRVVWSMVLGRDPLGLAQAYFQGDIDIEGDIFGAVSLKDHLHSLRMSPGERLRSAYTALQLKNLTKARRSAAAEFAPSQGQSVKTHSKEENRAAVRFHYDVSNSFYALWLDRAMVYSCAYFEKLDNDLDQAQEAKLDHICRKLQLKPSDRFLDIGCGWGALVMHAAKRYGVLAHGVTLSQKQLQLARRRIAEAGLEHRVTVELQDYRDLKGDSVYEKIASVGMFEHVGLKNLPAYFSTVQRLLKPGGLFLNHGITNGVEGWRKTLSTQFINRYVFPDGELDTISNIQRHMERANFEIADVESLRAHYALTLRRWVERLERRRTDALHYVNEATYRVWRLYMAACAVGFECGEIGVYQVLAAKRRLGPACYPMTRRHLYTSPSAICS
jgi:cyclopropane-fatty-acyl-phospholipid synthase